MQLAKWRGAYVIATASAHNHDYLGGAGADEVVDYRSVRFEDVAGKVDLVFDTISWDTQERSWKMVKRGARLHRCSPVSGEGCYP